MKKLLFLILTLISVVAAGQDIKPLNPEFKMLQTPNNAVFWWNPIDSSVWVYKGAYGWTRLQGYTHSAYKYVPYNGATKDVNLGNRNISSTKQRLPLFNGACQVSTIVDNGDGSITVGNGEYHLSTNIEGRGTENFVITGGVFTLTNNSQNYLVADYNGGTPILKVITDVSLINETTVVPVYTAYRTGNILHFQNWDSLGLALANKVHQSIVKTQRYRRESGMGLSTYATRYISLGSGRVWVGAVPVDVSAIATSTDNLYFFYHSGGVWTFSTQTQIPNTQYDDGTNLVTLTANRYAVNWVYRGIESQKHLYITLGTGDYTLAQAQEAIAPSPPTQISSHAMLVGKIIIQNGTDTPISVQSAFDTQFSTATPNAHNDLTGRDVADVHPAGSISFSPTGTYTATTVASALAQIDTNTPDRSITNELNTSMTFNPANKQLTVFDGSGNSVTTVISISGGNSANLAYLDTASVLNDTIAVNFPIAFTHDNYELDLQVWYEKTISGKTFRVNNAVYGFTQDKNGFSFVVDTVAGFYKYYAVDTTNVFINGTGFINEAPADGKIYGRKDSTWVEVISGSAADQIYGEIPSGTINGSNTDFTLSQIPLLNSERLYLNGVRQIKTTDYTLTGQDISILKPPQTGDIIIVDYLKESTTVTNEYANVIPTGTINGSNTDFTIPDIPTVIQVYLNGVRQLSSIDYIITGSTITFINPPQNGDIIIVDYLT